MKGKEIYIFRSNWSRIIRLTFVFTKLTRESVKSIDSVKYNFTHKIAIDKHCLIF